MHRLFYLIFLVFLSYTSRSQTITGTLEFCEGSSTTLSVSGAPVGATYQWQRSSNNNNWNNITGSTNSSLIVDQPDYYRVLVKSIATISVRVLLNSKPIPDFTFSNNACSGSGVLFTSNVTSGTGPFIYRWDFGDGTFSSAQNPTHIFNSTGCSNANFTVSLAVTDAKGCSNFINKIITIKQAPDVQVTDPNNIFSPFSNCNNNPTVGNPTFTITVANISPSISCINAYSLDWGDGTAIENNIVFPKTHTYTQLGAFKLVVSAVGSNGCVNSKSYTVANQSNPGVGFGTIPNTTTGLCAPAEIPLLISNWQNNSPGTTYSLTFGDGTSLFLTHPLNASLTTDTIKHTYTKSSCPNPTYTVILSVQNACSTTPYTAGNIQVSIKPFAAFNADTSACVGQKICFSNTTITGNTGTACSNATIYNWDFGDNTANSTEASPCHTYSKTGTYTLTLTASNPCGSSTIKKKICVVASPISSFTINNNEGCSPVSVTAANSSNTLNSCASATYFWSVSYVSNCGNVSMWSFTNNTNSGSLNPSFIFSNAGTYTVSLTVSNLCGSNTSTKTVTVKQAPLVLLNSLPAFCLPATVNPASLVTNCGTSPVTYNWTFPSGSPASSTLQNPGPVSYNNAGSFNILLAVTNECGSANASNTIIINPTPVTPSAGSNSPVCSGNSLNLTANSGTSGVIYNWAGPNGFSSNLQNPVRPNSTINMSGNYTVNSILNGCTSGLATIPVVVNQTPLAPVVNPAGPYCQNAVAVRLSANVSPGNTLRWYKTALGGQYSDTAFIPSTTTLGSTTYYVSQVSPGACESERSAITVSINPVPAIKGIYTDPTNCTIANGSIILSGVSAFVTYTIQYTKIGNTPSTISLSADGNGNLIIPGLSPGTYDNIFVNLSGCLSNQLGPFTLKNPQNPATPSAGSNSPLCSGISLKLTASSSSTGVGYNWTGPNGFTSSLQNPVIPNSTAIMGGIYNVTSVLNGCTSGTASTTVVVNQTPLAPTANTSIPYCQNAVAVRLAANVSPGNTLRWYKTATGGQYSDTAFIPLTNNLGSTTYYVSQVSASSCESERTSITVIINSVPRITGSSTNPSSCNSSDGMIDITGILPNTFYDVQYTKNAGPATLLSLQSNNSGHLLILNLSTGNYSNIIVTQNGCSSNIVGPFTIINPPGPPTPTISSNGPICSGNTLRLTASSAPGAAIYFWTGPNSFTSTLQNPTLDNLGTNGSGIYSLKITLNGCESGTTTTNVIVNQTPSAPSVTSPVGYCQNTTASPLSANADAGNQLLWYNSLIGGTSSSSAPIPNTAIVGTNTYYVSQVSINASCESSRMPIRVTINPVAIISATSTDPTNCTISNGLILISGVTAFVTYNISYTKNGGSTTSIPAIANGNGTITISGLSPGKFENISVSLNGCSSNMVGPLTLINPPIPATPSAGSNSPLCSGTALNLTANSITSGVDYTGQDQTILLVIHKTL